MPFSSQSKISAPVIMRFSSFPHTRIMSGSIFNSLGEFPCRLPLSFINFSQSAHNFSWRAGQGNFQQLVHLLYLDFFYQPSYPANLGSSIEAKLNTKKNPHMSVTVVRSGPET